jgi:serine/threonine protein kinase
MTTPRHVSRRAFLSHLRRSGLLSAEELSQAQQLLPEVTRGRLLARALVEKGVLTRFQAERLLIGRTDGFVLDQYVVLEELGRGGMGWVFKARHRTMNRVVALKVLAPGLTKTERAQEMFLREVRAVAQLVHPNLVTAFDANLVGDRYYLVLEYVDGPNLDQLVRTRGPLAVGQACDFIRQAASGLQCAHTAGMVHRDIKPANLLVQRQAADGGPGLVKVSDFGLARLQEGADAGPGGGTLVTRPNTVMGTPDFLSPEQARNLHNTDIRSDLYSLGCTFYYLLTGQVPFPGGTSLEKLIRHNTEQPAPVEELRPEVPAAVAAIVRRLLAKKPEDRFRTPAEVATALEPFSVRGPTPWEPFLPSSDPDLELATPNPEGSDPLMPVAADPAETFPPHLGLTPLSAASGAASRGKRQRRSRRLVAGLVAAVLLTLAALCAVLLRG